MIKDILRTKTHMMVEFDHKAITVITILNTQNSKMNLCVLI